VPSILAKLNCFLAGTFVYGLAFSFVMSWVIFSRLPQGTPDTVVAVLALLPLVAAGAFMAWKWKGNTLFPKYVEPEYSTRYFIGQCLISVCNAAVVVAIAIGCSVKTQTDTAGALRFMLGIVFILPGFLIGTVGLGMISRARSNTSLERTREG
jgi:hypothetical protein